MKYYFVDDLFKKRTALLESKTAKPFIDDLIKKADIAVQKSVPSAKFSNFMIFFENGSRAEYEKGYFEKRNDCMRILSAYFLTNNQKYLTPLIDYINYICDEFTWCVPAHCDIHKFSTREIVERVDLFQAETTRLFSEIIMLVGNNLPSYVKERMKYEVERRVFRPIRDLETFQGPTFYWENMTNNWSAVCGAGVTLGMMCFMEDKEIQTFIPRITGWMDTYLEGISEDGCCVEGMAYWKYGFFHFTLLADIMKKYTKGKINYFEKEKVKKLALFNQRMILSDSVCVSVSDSSDEFSFQIGLISFLKKIYPEVSRPDLKLGQIWGNVLSTASIIWFDEDYTKDDMTEESFYYEEPELFISKKPTYSFCAVGGHNAQPHNHNDVGSFIITNDDKVILNDLGSGKYTKDYFAPATRYNYLVTGSQGHSVPIINGTYQIAGRDHSAKNVSCSDKHFELELQDAYEDGIIEKIHRHFSLKNDRIVLTDTFVYSRKTESVIERLVTKSKPEIREDYIIINKSQIHFDKEKYSLKVTETSYKGARGVSDIPVYLIDFEFTDKSIREFKIEIRL